MLGRLLATFLSFLLACLGAGLTTALFATTPAELVGLPADVASDRIVRLIETGVFAAVQSFVFSVPFAVAAIAVGEWQRIRVWTYYAGAAVLIALVGFLAHWSGEMPGQPTIVNNYALSAFITAGFVAGLVYWVGAGRSAGRDERRGAGVPTSPATTGGTPAEGAGKA